ncbi:MAG: hypothetical protein RL095_4117 [Verrucomicrobiota bacterium]|jgi:MFS family permease
MKSSWIHSSPSNYNKFLLLVAGLGGLLYGIDIGVIDPALPYLNQSVQLSEQQSSYVVAAVLAGSLMGSILGGFLADWLGRKLMMIFSGLLFVGSVGVIFTSQGFEALIVGRVLQGLSGGVIAVVVPLFLAESLPAQSRGRGTAIFQFALTFGIVLAAFVGGYFIGNAERAIEAAGSNSQEILGAADYAWRNMFLAVVYPGVLFLLGSFLISESPRWLFRRGRTEAARAALLRLGSPEQCEIEMKEMADSLAHEHAKPKVTFFESLGEIFTRRKYVLPFVLACIILGCNQATGINSVLQFMSTILQKAGLDPIAASSYGTGIKIVNCLMTIVAILLVERKGRTFLLKIGTGGIIVSLCVLAAVFHSVESKRVDVDAEVRAMIRDNQLHFDVTQVKFQGQNPAEAQQLSLLVSYGQRQQVLTAFMPTPEAQQVLELARQVFDQLPPSDRALISAAQQLKQKGLAHLDESEKRTLDQGQKILSSLPRETQTLLADARRIRAAQVISVAPDPKDADNAGQPLEIKRAKLGPIPSRDLGLVAAACIAVFIAFFSIGPGVCVWLALSELMPTRIRAAGMGIALLINSSVATAIAAAFLPIVGNYGFAAMFLFWAACTVIYFITAAFFLPETKGKTLEEIESHFEGRKP